MLFGAGEPLTLDIKNLSWLTSFTMIGQTVLGLASLTVAFGFLTNFLVSERIAQMMAKEKIKMEDHVIVCGLGNVGYHGSGGGWGIGSSVAVDPTSQGVMVSQGEYAWSGGAGTAFWIDPVEDIVAVSIMPLMGTSPSSQWELRVATNQSLIETQE